MDTTRIRIGARFRDVYGTLWEVSDGWGEGRFEVIEVLEEPVVENLSYQEIYSLLAHWVEE